MSPMEVLMRTMGNLSSVGAAAGAGTAAGAGVGAAVGFVSAALAAGAVLADEEFFEHPLAAIKRPVMAIAAKETRWLLQAVD